VAFGDATWWLFTLNSFAPWLFLPLPAVAVYALLRRRLLLPACLAGMLLWASLWGALFLPRGQAEAGQSASLRIMTYNLLGASDRPGAVLDTIRKVNPDVISLEELNEDVAAMLARRLATEYPYQHLDLTGGLAGSGLISRYPFATLDVSIEDSHWVSPPLVVRLDVDGREITYVRFHATSRPQYHEQRERQASKLAAFAASHEGPLVMAGDLNATSTNRAYSLIADELKDAWKERGHGFGNTFPGASRQDVPGSARFELFGVSVPKWLVRIDYVFHSRDLKTIAARTGPFDGSSDHRPVVVDLALPPR
jgi:endonuclease/exonuclease/phosphatase (EEP) superfamily protein YafD